MSMTGILKNVSIFNEQEKNYTEECKWERTDLKRYTHREP